MTPQQHQELIKSQIAASYNPLEKSQSTEDNNLDKGGEGSRGGKIIGHTTSGKPIYQHKNSQDGGKYHYGEFKDGKDESSKLTVERIATTLQHGNHGVIVDTGGVYKHFLIDKNQEKHTITNVSKKDYERHTGSEGGNFAKEDRLNPLKS